MDQRAFVIVPLLEIAPEIILPTTGPAKLLLPKLKNQIVRSLHPGEIS